jgi:hypothetical protein
MIPANEVNMHINASVLSFFMNWVYRAKHWVKINLMNEI